MQPGKGTRNGKAHRAGIKISPAPSQTSSCVLAATLPRRIASIWRYADKGWHEPETVGGHRAFSKVEERWEIGVRAVTLLQVEDESRLVVFLCKREFVVDAPNKRGWEV